MKGKRLTLIRQIVKTISVETQEELVDLLREKHGMVVTQATISRDIKEIGLLKVTMDNGHSRYALPGVAGQITPPLEKVKRALLDNLVSIDYAGNMIILRTMPGNAHSIAALFDAMGWENVVGTLAGDDTILVIMRLPEQIEPFIARIYEIME
ncbi:MAG: arginine repressor [Negativicutes bacterium]|nr:arginine repressor [Negativicutes bacterium]